MVTNKTRNFLGFAITLVGVIVGIFFLTRAENILGYISCSLFTLFSFILFISFLYDIIKKKRKNEK